MRKIIQIAAALLALATSAQAAEKMEIKDITDGAFSARTISGIHPLPGSDQYARISSDGRQVVCYSFRTGKQTGVLFDVANTMGQKIDRFDSYTLSPQGDKMLVSTNTRRVYRRSAVADYYIYTIRTRKLEKLSDGGREQVPLWSPDGNQIAFVRDNNIHLVKLLYDNAESQVTKDGKFGEVLNGIPDWVNEEEFSLNRSFCFSADGTMICWIRYDESQVKTYSLQMFKGLKPEQKEYEAYPGLYSYKYPKAGEQNSTVSAWSYDIKSHKAQRLQVPLDADGYMPRIVMTDDAASVVVYTMNRHQDRLDLYSVNPRSTVARLLLREEAKCYVKEEAMGDIRIGHNSILLPSDRDGYTHLYIYNMAGTLLRKIGDGKYDITEICGYDEATGDVYYQAAALNAHDRQIYVAHKNGKTERLTTREGWNTAIFSGDFQYYIHTWSDYDTPYVYTLRQTRGGKTLATMEDNAALRQKTARYGWVKRERFSFTTSEGVTLDGWMVKPADFDPAKRYPVVMHQYSGPGSQQVINSWGAGSMGGGGVYDQYLASQGFVAVTVDGRGTGGRGADFEKCTYQNLGLLESRDQVEAAIWLGKQSWVDAGRIGIWGWSYGGFNTLMSLSEGRPVFAAGVAVAPPTHWRYYDSVYTERYMRTPGENPTGYGLNPISRAGDLHGALLICHGVADDNVHPQNSYEYAEALVQADKDFREIWYTNRNHSIYGGNTRRHLMRQITQHFVQYLMR